MHSRKNILDGARLICVLQIHNRGTQVEKCTRGFLTRTGVYQWHMGGCISGEVLLALNNCIILAVLSLLDFGYEIES